MEKKLPENAYTKLVNDLFGFWPAWLRNFWCFYFSYTLAVDTTFYLANYYDNNLPNQFLWLTIFLFYTISKKITASTWPHTTIATGLKYYLLLLIVISSSVFSIIIIEKSKSHFVKILLIDKSKKS